MMFLSQIGWWAAFLALSAFFSGMEEAFVSSDKLRYALDKKQKGAFNFVLNTLYGHPRQFMAMLSVGNLMALVFFVISSVSIFRPIIEQYIVSESLFVYALLVLGITVLILITGEFLPRILFRQKANLWVKLLAIPTFLFYLILYPVTRILIVISKGFLSAFGIKMASSEDKLIGKVELDSYIKQGIDEMPENNEVDSEVKIFKNALDFSTMKLKDCMVPRTDIIAVSSDSKIEELKEKFIETGLSRILVYDETIDNIIGYIHMWEMFNNPDDWTKKIASISFVPESMQANQLMSELMQASKSIAVVVDEFGGTSGIVTMEDLVEEIFGDIEDEYDVRSGFVKKESDNEYVLSGRVEIDYLNETYYLDLPESDDYTTVAGLVLHNTQRFPKTYEVVHIGKFTFKIQKVTARKIEVLRLTIENSDADA